jgi:hypothetical protein
LVSDRLLPSAPLDGSPDRYFGFLLSDGLFVVFYSE